MSRELPEFPDLDYLRKQAKARLRQLQQSDPTAKLTEVQLVIAREHGFASWAKLKAHVESLPGRSGAGGGSGPTVGVTASSDPQPGLFPRFTVRARRLIFFARYFAGNRRSDRIEVHHLLLALFEEDADRLRRMVNGSAAADNVRARLGAIHADESVSTEARSIPLSEDSRQMVQRAAEEADRLAHANIGTRHFWLAFLRDETSPAITVLTEVLKQSGISLDNARSDIIADPDEG